MKIQSTLALILAALLLAPTLALAQVDSVLDDQGLYTFRAKLERSTWTGACAQLTLTGAPDCNAERIAGGGCPASQEGFLFPNYRPQLCLVADIGDKLTGSTEPGEEKCLFGLGETVRTDVDIDGDIDVDDAGLCPSQNNPVGTIVEVTGQPRRQQCFSAGWAEVRNDPDRWLVDVVSCPATGGIGQEWRSGEDRQVSCDPVQEWSWAPGWDHVRLIVGRALDEEMRIREYYADGSELLKAANRAVRGKREEAEFEDVTP